MRALLIAVIVAFAPGAASAQAWLPQQGETTASLVLTDVLVREHYLPAQTFDRGHIRTKTLIADVTYGLRDDLAVSVALPIVQSRYWGAFPHGGGVGLDDGASHTAIQDLRVDVRYGLARGPLMITPFVGSIVPATDYEYFAHAAPGRRVRELQIGTYVAGTLDRIMPGLFVQGRYAYGFAEKILDIPHNRSQLGIELGYFVTPSVRIIGMLTGQRTHGGVDLSLTAGREWPAERFRNHDRIVAEHYANVGGGVGWTVNDTVDLFGSLARTVTGRNTHKMHYAATIGASIRLRKPALDPFSASRREGLVRCVCQKTAGGRMMGG